MKLLMINSYFESHRGGLELIGGRLVRELVRLGEDARWLASDVTPPSADRELGPRSLPVRVCNITERRLGIPFPFPGFGAIARIGRAVRWSDAVLLQDSLYPMCVAAFLFARLWRRPVVVAQHVGIVPYRNPVFRGVMGLLNRLVARPILARAEAVAFFSEITANYFAPLRRRGPTKLMFTGVDTEIFHPAAADAKPELRARLGLASDHPVALFVGRFVEKKGLHVLARMARARPDIQWVFAGWGHLDPEAWGLTNVIVRRGLTGQDLAPLYQASDVFVLPSKGEGFPLVIQEALACGLPVVCSADTAHADAAAMPLLCPVTLDETNLDGTAAAFCAEVDRNLEDGEHRRELADEKFRFVSRRYSWSACGAAYRDLIRSAVYRRDDALRESEPHAGPA